MRCTLWGHLQNWLITANCHYMANFIFFGDFGCDSGISSSLALSAFQTTNTNNGNKSSAEAGTLAAQARRRTAAKLLHRLRAPEPIAAFPSRPPTPPRLSRKGDFFGLRDGLGRLLGPLQRAARRESRRRASPGERSCCPGPLGL